MPTLIYKGDTINNFGSFLPAPFIERITLNENDIQVKIALYITVPQEIEYDSDDPSDEQTIIEADLSELKYYIVIANSAKGETFEAIANREISIFNSLFSSDYEADAAYTHYRYTWPYWYKWNEFWAPWWNWGNIQTGIMKAVGEPLDGSYLKALARLPSGTTYSYPYDWDGAGAECDWDFATRFASKYSTTEPSDDDEDDESGMSEMEWEHYQVWGCTDCGTPGAGAELEVGGEVVWTEGTSTKNYHLNPDGLAQYLEINFTDFEYVESVYDSAGNKIFKYIYETDTDEEGREPGYLDPNVNKIFADYSNNDRVYGKGLISPDAPGMDTLEDFDNINVYTFSSTLSWIDDDGDAVINMIENNPILLQQNISDISYEKLIEDSAVASVRDPAWVDSEGNPFDGVPLQQIMAKYHKPTKITHKEIVSGFEELLENFKTTAETDSTLQDAMDNVSHVLGTYGTQFDLLPRLNELRKAWADKSFATNAGKLYHAFKKTLFNTNAIVSRAEELTKRLFLNPKLLDLRIIAPEQSVSSYSYEEFYGISPTDEDDSGDPAYTYTDGGREIWYYDGDYYTYNKLVEFAEEEGIDVEEDILDLDEGIELYLPNEVDEWQYNDGSWSYTESETADADFLWAMASAETFYSDEIEDQSTHFADYIKVQGYAFVDLESLLFRASNISRIFDTQKIENIFGTNFLNCRFGGKAVGMHLKRFDENGEVTLDIDSRKVYVGYGDHVQVWNYNGYDFDGRSESGGGSVANISVKSVDYETTFDGMSATKTYYTYIRPRNFDTTWANSDLKDYRLFCIEFQDLIPALDEEDAVYSMWGAPVDWTYYLQVWFYDATMDIYDALVTNYYDTLYGDFSDYYDLAMEDCHYNEADGTFNAFFQEGMTTAYGDGDFSEAPWYRCAFVYNFHRDLLFDTFGGDQELIAQRSVILADKISPWAGNKGNLELFQEQMETLYNTYYNAEDSFLGAIATQLKEDVWRDMGIEIPFPSIYEVTDLQEQIDSAILEDDIFTAIFYVGAAEQSTEWDSELPESLSLDDVTSQFETYYALMGTLEDEDIVNANIQWAFKAAFPSQDDILGEGEGMTIDMDPLHAPLEQHPIINMMQSDAFDWSDSDNLSPTYLDALITFVGIYAMNKDLQDSAGNYLEVSEILRNEIEDLIGEDDGAMASWYTPDFDASDLPEELGEEIEQPSI